MRSIELFTGAGGLALGLQYAGFKSDLMVEWDHDACNSVRTNIGGPTVGWPLRECDVRDVDFRPFEDQIDLLAGGPPCQPFSIGGKHRGPNDPRDMWPQAIRAVREARPKAFLFENVRGLTRKAFADYLRYIVARLRHPELEIGSRESVDRHLSRLEKAASNTYDVAVHQVNAADYGAAQKRYRVVIVGVRRDLRLGWHLPERTHSSAALLADKWISGAYWERHRLGRRDRPQPSMAEMRLAREATSLFGLPSKPWRTVRDAIADLPAPLIEGEPTVPNHRFQPGAKAYVGHTGSVIDEPAKALKAGDHGVPGGENMLAHPNGTVRYFTVRESARLQGFPDTYVFPGSWSENMRQLGNAVPVELGQAFAKSVADLLMRSRRKRAA